MTFTKMRTPWYAWRISYAESQKHKNGWYPSNEDTVKAYQNETFDEEVQVMKDKWTERVIQMVNIEDIPLGAPIAKRLYEWYVKHFPELKGGWMSVWLARWRMVPVYQVLGDEPEPYIQWRDRIETFTSDGSVKYEREPNQKAFQIISYHGGEPAWVVHAENAFEKLKNPETQSVVLSTYHPPWNPRGRTMMTRAMGRIKRLLDVEVDSDKTE